MAWIISCSQRWPGLYHKKSATSSLGRIAQHVSYLKEHQEPGMNRERYMNFQQILSIGEKKHTESSIIEVNNASKIST